MKSLRCTRRRLAGASLGLAGVLLAGACQDAPAPNSPGLYEPPVLSTAIVSNPVSLVKVSTAAAIPSFSVMSGIDVAYVSLPPGTITSGLSATIADTRAGSFVTAAMMDGGFDPVPVAANEGDTLQLDVTVTGDSVPQLFTVVVPTRRPPVLVRTEPPPKKRDVPLNAPIVVVFSEPIDSRTVTTQSVQLLAGGQPVSGQPVLAAGGLRVEFRPDRPLAGNTLYTLTVTTDVTDLSGDHVERSVSAEFTTAAGTASPGVASVAVSPATVTLKVGDTTRLVATARDSAGGVVTGATVVWLTTDSTVAKVSATGLVTGLRVGLDTVTAVVEQARGTASVRVDSTATSGAPASLTVTPNVVTLSTNGTQQFTAVGRDSSGNIVAISPTWSVNGGGTIGTTGLFTAGTVPGVFPSTVEVAFGGKYGYATVAVTDPAAGSRIASVSAGGQHTCALIVGGAAYCWGDNAHGALGNGTTVSSSAAVAVSLGRPFYTLTAGGTHTCGTTPSGFDTYVTYCWGGNASGQLGDGTTIDKATPQAVDPDLVQGAVITAGSNHTCNVDLWVWLNHLCWGANDRGQLGNGTTALRTSPVPIQWPSQGGPSRFEQVIGGGTHTCAQAGGGDFPSHKWYCWGANDHGEIGDGTTTGRTVFVLAGGGMSFGYGFAAEGGVSAGERHTCGVTASGAAYCWGDNSRGQLGDGTTTDRASPVLVAGGLSFVAVSAGSSHTCGLTAAGAAYCWGSNDNGQLGDGTTTQRASPVPVAGGLSFAINGSTLFAVTLSAGRSHTCGATPTGAAYCWGANGNGQLGNGTTIGSTVPVKVTGQP